MARACRPLRKIWSIPSKVLVTDGPYAETKEQLGGILLLEAKDLNHGRLEVSAHPGAEPRAFQRTFPPAKGKEISRITLRNAHSRSLLKLRPNEPGIRDNA